MMKAKGRLTMKKIISLTAAFVGFCFLGAAPAKAQYVVYSPTRAPVVSAPVTSSVVTSSPGACGCSTAPTTTYYAPQPANYAPTTTYYAPTTTSYYAPATTSYYAPSAYTSCYSPGYTSYYAPAYTSYYAPGAVVVGRPAVVSQKVYYPGQPVRNFFRAITP
jgi:hypothetical protein